VSAPDPPVPHADKIIWETQIPVWVDQWPLTQEKLKAASMLVQEQLAADHVEPSTSPWNTPIFVIKKKSGKWRLLQDLRAINRVMRPMGALQPGIPTPVAIPKDYYKMVIDLKDCFFTIPLHPEDRPYFAFSLPRINFQGPMQRFQWKVLPQGMANSPSLCQKYVAQAVDPVRKRWPQIYILHYMDDLLIAAPDTHNLNGCYLDLYKALTTLGLQIAPDKVQTQDPYTYLGLQLQGNQIQTPKIQLRVDHLHTLNDFQKLMGDIQWLRPYLKLPTCVLLPLNDILKGDSHPTSPRKLTPEAQQALNQVTKAITQQFVTQISYNLPLILVILHTPHTPTGIFWQRDPHFKNKGCPLFWVHLPTTSSKVITVYPAQVASVIVKGRLLSRQHFGKDPDKILIPYTKDQTQFLLQTEDEWSIALSGFLGTIDNHLPSDPLLHFAQLHPFIFPKITQKAPIPQALTVFTDGSSNGCAVFVVGNQPTTFETACQSAQLVELFAIAQVFITFLDKPVNIYTDSAYIAHSVPLLEISPAIKASSNAAFLFHQLQQLIQTRRHPFFLGHIRAHSDLPGPLTQGNAQADAATRSIFPIFAGSIQRATELHTLHHLNSQSLRLFCKITRQQAREIVKACPACTISLPIQHLGVNPRGLLPNQVWQMDVTHFPEFGKTKYIHVTIDTFSGFIFASPHSGEATKDALSHLVSAFTVMGKPTHIKTDNGPAYTSSKFKQFCSTLQISHTTGIPYNPQGQGIVERAHLTLKTWLTRLKASTLAFTTPRDRLNHTLFTLNFLTLDSDGHSAADRHWHPSSNTVRPPVMWRDPLTYKWKGPDPVLIWGRGSACVLDQEQAAPRWLPERLIKQVNDLTKPREKDPLPEDALSSLTDAVHTLDEDSTCDTPAKQVC
jgi:transposase InsO family protein